MPHSQPALHELRPILPDHPTVRTALWHLDGLKREGMAAELWLTPRERAEVAEFKHDRRRREWTAARIALKRLLVEDGIIRSPLHAEIRKNELGQPHVVVYVPETGRYDELSCSLAHKNTLVVAAYASAGVAVGVDIECRSWRLPHLRRRFESPEDALLDGTDTIARYTVLWTFKEATSKLLGKGYACGFSRIVCRETRYGTCEVTTPDDVALHGRYVWMDRYAIALVTDLHPANPPEPEPPAPSRPWFEQVARARRLRSLRRARAISMTQRATPSDSDDAPSSL